MTSRPATPHHRIKETLTGMRYRPGLNATPPALPKSLSVALRARG
jgi:hypothetical protein